ncbi:MAG: malto-oligosyltrehalose synthase, partial [Hyphomicrobiales bacterium]
MTVPSATYRLQFREHLDFETAARLMPYLARLGVSHVYASPLQTARRGSTHGYDGIDFEAMDPALGVFEGFRAMAAAMQASGLRLLLDVVPNHMGVTPENPWWRDVLEWGADSAYARHFDIDWSAPRLSLPILGDTYARTLAKGDLKVGFDATGGTFTVAYYD